MMTPRRSTVYIEEPLHKALRLKAAETDQSISDLVNAAVRRSLVEDAEDLELSQTRMAEPTISFSEFVADLKRRGKL